MHLAVCVWCWHGEKKHSRPTPVLRSDPGPCAAPSAPCAADAACPDDPAFHSQSPRQWAGSVGDEAGGWKRRCQKFRRTWSVATHSSTRRFFTLGAADESSVQKRCCSEWLIHHWLTEEACGASVQLILESSWQPANHNNELLFHNNTKSQHGRSQRMDQIFLFFWSAAKDFLHFSKK